MEIKTDKILDKWKLFTLTNDNHMQVGILDYGGIITKITVPDKNGNMENVVLGYKNYQDYETNSDYLGAIVGRVSGRIQGSSFNLDGKTFYLEANDGDNHLHGGSTGFHQVVWDAMAFKTDHYSGVKLTHKSFDGEGGYPGNVKVSVTYTLTNHNQLIIDYEGITDRKTIIAVTNHTYFNLCGDLANTVLNHMVTTDSSSFAELDENLIPNGKMLDVSNTPFDFRTGQLLRDGIEVGAEQNKLVGNGYDHYFLFDRNREDKVVVKEPVTGRVLSIKTDEPGMVMYSANNLTEELELVGGKSKRYQGVCFETQAYPASIHHEGLPSVVLEPGKKYNKRTVFTFDVC